MAYDRTRPPPGLNNQGSTSTTTNSGGTNVQTSTTGPSSSSSSGSQQTTRVGQQVTNSQSARNVNENVNRTITTEGLVQNMDDGSLDALQKLIAQLGAGGSAENQALANEYIDQLARSRAQEGAYGRGAAFGDAAGAAASQSARALEQIMPTLTAGIDSAGTSGSAMQALLAQRAASDAAGLAAELSLNASVQYGQIKNQALANTTNLLAGMGQIQDATMNQLLSALNIAKGATTKTRERVTDITNRTVSERASGRETINTTSSENTLTNNTQRNSGSTNTSTSTSSPTTSTTVTSPNQVGSGGGITSYGPGVSNYDLSRMIV